MPLQCAKRRGIERSRRHQGREADELLLGSGLGWLDGARRDSKPEEEEGRVLHPPLPRKKKRKRKKGRDCSACSVCRVLGGIVLSKAIRGKKKGKKREVLILPISFRSKEGETDTLTLAGSASGCRWLFLRNEREKGRGASLTWGRKKGGEVLAERCHGGLIVRSTTP